VEILRTIVAIMVVLVTVVVVHELGHYLVAKRSGIQVDEFAVGFGPKLVWRRIGETVYALRLLPAGGFVRLAGMTGLPEEKDPGPRAFWRASIPRRSATILAGGVFNLVFAGIVFSALAIPGHDSQVSRHEPLANAGMQSGDQVVAVDGRRIDTSSPERVTDGLHAATDASQGRPVHVVYRTPSGAEHTITVTPVLVLYNLDRTNTLPDQLAVDTIDGHPVGSGDPSSLFGNGASVKVTGHTLDDARTTVKGVVDGVSSGNGGVIGHAQAAWRLGFTPGYPGNSLPYALARGFTAVPTTIADTFTGLWDILTTPTSGGLRGNVQGPVGVVRSTGDAAQNGWMDFLNWIGFLSLNLGLFNLLPIPFLDGGRFAFIVLEALRRRRVDPRREAMVHYFGLMLILALVVYVTFTGDIGGRS
jgi:regulator of sigma E protease